MHAVPPPYLDIPVSHLVDQAIYYLDFMEKINQFRTHLYSDRAVRRSVMRYEKHWLPFYKQTVSKIGSEMANTLYPPDDIAWVWHCHMLTHADFVHDYSSIFKIPIHHKLHSLKEIEEKQTYTKSLWDKAFSNLVPFFIETEATDYKDDETSNFQSQLSCDLVAACHKHKKFYYKVSMPHFRNKFYLDLCLQRYKRFLQLKKNRPEMNQVAYCLGIDLMWRTHRLSPYEYANTMANLFPIGDSFLLAGFGLEDSKRLEDKQRMMEIFDKTKHAWMTDFVEQFYFAGSMQRSEAPYFLENGCFSSSSSPNPVDLRTFMNRNGRAQLDAIKITSSRKRDERKFHIQVFQQNNGREAYKFDTRANKEKSLLYAKSCYIDFDESVEDSFRLKIEIKRDGGIFSSDFVQPVEFCLKLPEDKNFDIYQEINLDFTYNKLVFNVWMKWHIMCACAFKLSKNSFSSYRMTEILDEYDVFDNLKNYFEFTLPDGRNIASNDNGSDCIRTLHLLKAFGVSSKAAPLLHIYQCEILHIPSIQWSSVKIIPNKETKLSTPTVTSHTIGLEQLPTFGQVKQDLEFPSHELSLKARLGEKAMLVRNSDVGDFALVKARWQAGAYQERFYMTTPGSSLIQVYFYQTKTTATIAELPFGSFKFQLSTDWFRVYADFKQDKLVVCSQNVLDSTLVENLVAVVLSVSILNALVQPLKKNSAYLVASSNKESDSTINYEHDYFHWLDMIGYQELVQHLNKNLKIPIEIASSMMARASKQKEEDETIENAKNMYHYWTMMTKSLIDPAN